MERETRECHECGAPTKLGCSVCKEAFYCSVDCQKKAWPEHKEFHKVCNSPKFDYPCDGDFWDENKVFDALQKNGYLIIKLKDSKDVQTMVEFRSAVESLFASPTKAKKSLKVPRGATLEGANVGYVNNPLGSETFDFRPDETLTKLYPDPTSIVSDFKQKYFRAYNLVAKVSLDLMAAIVAASKTGAVVDYSFGKGAKASCIRILNYTKPREWFAPHVDAGSVAVSMRGTTVGLGIYNKSLGGYCYPELAMDSDSDLVVIAGMDMDTTFTNGKIEATKHIVTTKEPRIVSLFNINTGIRLMKTFTVDEAEGIMKKFHQVNRPTKI